MPFSIIYARGSNYEFGNVTTNGRNEFSLPWPKLQTDLDHFRDTTTQNSANKQNVLIMGKNTFESMGKKALPKRVSIVVSKSLLREECDNSSLNIFYVSSLQGALNLAYTFKHAYTFVIGGVKLIEEAYLHPDLESVYLTVVKSLNETKLEANIKIDEKNLLALEHSWSRKNSRFDTDKGNPNFFLDFETYSRDKNNFNEDEYLALLQDTLSGNTRSDRTGVGTISKFGGQIRLSMQNGFTLLTTKYVDYVKVLKELLFFISGKSDTKILEAQGVNIWKGNTSREFLDNRGLKDTPEGHYLYSYGPCWRHFGGQIDEKTGEITGGVDQLQTVIDGIKKDPFSRRHVISAWDPSKPVALPQCHILIQFYVDKVESAWSESFQSYLDIHIYMRSVDLGIGLPYNIASYQFLLMMVSHLTNTTPRDVIFSFGDRHIYKNHVDQIQTQFKRPTRTSPEVRIRPDVKYETIEDFSLDSFLVEKYQPHPYLPMEMAV